jgi:RNA polymerase sigma factor (sigma-70 family)
LLRIWVEAKNRVSRVKKAEIREYALASVSEEHATRLSSFIRRKMRDRAESDEVLQDVFVEFIETFDVGTAIDSLGAWLVAVAQNKILDRFRRKKTREEHRRAVLESTSGERFSEDRPDDEWTRGWLRAEIIRAIELLPREQREVFVKHELEGKRFDEIAEETGIGVNTLLARKRYAVMQQRTHLKGVYDELE